MIRCYYIEKPKFYILFTKLMINIHNFLKKYMTSCTQLSGKNSFYSSDHSTKFMIVFPLFHDCFPAIVSRNSWFYFMIVRENSRNIQTTYWGKQSIFYSTVSWTKFQHYPAIDKTCDFILWMFEKTWKGFFKQLIEKTRFFHHLTELLFDKIHDSIQLPFDKILDSIPLSLTKFTI